MIRAGNLPRRWRTGRDDAHHAEALAGVLETPAIAPMRNGLTIIAQVGTREVLPFLVAVKSLHRQLGRGRVAIVDDGTLTGADRTILAFHCGDPEILMAGAVSLGGFPADGGWEPWLTAYDRRRGEYWLLLDPLAVASGPLPQVERAIAANRSFAAGTALVALAAGGPCRPDPHALFDTLGRSAAPAYAATELLMVREAEALELAGTGGLAHFGPSGAEAHAAAGRTAIEVLAGTLNDIQHTAGISC